MFLVNGRVFAAPVLLMRRQTKRCPWWSNLTDKLQKPDTGPERFSSTVTELIVPRIRQEFENKRNWIKKRIKENRESFKEQFFYRTYHDEDAEFMDGKGDDE